MWRDLRDGCPILSQAIGIEMLKTVFGIAVGHLEGPPYAYDFYKGDFNGKMSKYRFLAINTARNLLQPSS